MKMIANVTLTNQETKHDINLKGKGTDDGKGLGNETGTEHIKETGRERGRKPETQQERNLDGKGEAKQPKNKGTSTR